ncbi:hypothetical protein [Caulobacter sp. X]|jgi:hypothetical protein|uniref:hypothetical protein n=1 Tax=Caulobacter sp. X TaxID=2048901 RepID=UPI000C156305|nr:hypothetical protein [Caulobacter sp. X]PIB95345.1 hypothetical protein CSW60_22640 [Caulobacter sp. X]
MLASLKALLSVARPWSWALADRVSFVLESLAVAVFLFLLLTWSILGFDWQTTTHEWGSFWSHYAKASVEARRPVETVLLVALAVLWGGACLIRFRKARLAWLAWPRRAARPDRQEVA